MCSALASASGLELETPPPPSCPELDLFVALAPFSLAQITCCVAFLFWKSVETVETMSRRLALCEFTVSHFVVRKTNSDCSARG